MTLIFSITQGGIDREIMFRIPIFFNQDRRYVRKESQTSPFVVYETQKVDELLTNVCSHFDKHPVLSNKQNDFVNFKRVLLIMKRDKDLQNDSLREIINLVYVMNLTSANDGSPKKKPKEYWLEIIDLINN